MYKRKICLLLIVVFLFLFKVDVNAAGTCTTEEQKILKIEAENIVFAYELVHDTDERTDIEYYYNITINNLGKNLIVEQGNAVYDKSYENANGEINISKSYMIGETVSFKILGGPNTKCQNEKIMTELITLPYYNKYSTREECKEYSEYDICKTNINTTNVSEKKFLEEIEKVKKIEEEKNKTSPQKKEETIFQKIINFYKENITFLLPITIGVIVLIGIIIRIIINKNKKKIKIDLSKI